MHSLESNSIDMIFADPPYFLSNGGISVQSGKRVIVDKGNWDKSVGIENDFQFHLSWIIEARRILKENGTIWITGTYHSIYQCGYALQKLGFHILNDICWFKPNANPNLSCRFFTASHETIIWARKSKKGKHFFDYLSMKKGNWNEDFIKKPGLQMRSVWSIYPPKRGEKIYGKHPTQKPEELLKRIILASTQVNDIILDPFSGSGTTCIMANALGRKYIGIEKEEIYLKTSIQRLESQ
ncbi:site-specific DNA-methyltransferase [Candidatus Gracilibacteria bacterium]|nr:site-specific DNA-methyltransferase [Candidatus Gracilibacteria bacterium]